MRLLLSSPLRALPGQFNYMTQGFGGNGEWYRANGINILGHNGLDFITENGQEIYAAHDGVVMRLETDSKGGVGLSLRTKEKYDHGSDQVYYKTIYWHLEKYAVAENTEVRAGDVVAYADNTGFSTGSHLHFALKPLRDDFSNLAPDNGYYGAIDPLPFLFQNDMEHIIIGNTQYLRYAPLKIAISIGDTWELEKLRERGLTSQPAPAPESSIAGYWIIPGVELGRLKDILNF